MGGSAVWGVSNVGGSALWGGSAMWVGQPWGGQQCGQVSPGGVSCVGGVSQWGGVSPVAGEPRPAGRHVLRRARPKKRHEARALWSPPPI